MDGGAFRASLLEWYRDNRRDLPWRRTSDPYAILVSEVMCQQTRVDVVVPYFERWMKEFPDLETLAEAHEGEVYVFWSGLGYYRRAANLHHAAQKIVDEGWPDALEDLPGVGPYIAGAVASIAFGRPQAAIDGNVQRVLSRVADIRDDVTRGVGKRAIEGMANALLQPSETGDWTQALMELGARICTPRNPRCDECPVAIHCEAENPAMLPVKAPPRRPTLEHMQFARIRKGSKILLVKRPKGGLLAGTWGLPGGPVGEPLEEIVRSQTGIAVAVQSDSAQATHTFSHRKWAMEVHDGQPMSATELSSDAKWVEWESLQEWGVSTAMKKAIAAEYAPQAH